MMKGAVFVDRMIGYMEGYIILYHITGTPYLGPGAWKGVNNLAGGI